MWARLSESVESRLWPVPLAAVIVAVALGLLLPRVDVLVDAGLPTAVDSAVFNGGADTARTVLSSIAGSLITATSLTFSLTVIALQLASSQASPRVLRLFARDRQVQWTLAAFLATFAYSVTVLRSVRSADDGVSEVVPRIAVTVAFVLTLLSVVMLVFFLAHLAAELRVETMLKDIHAETDRTIDLIDERNAAVVPFLDAIRVPRTRHAVQASSSGFITARDHDVLIEVAAQHTIVIQESKLVGENLVAGTPLAFWWGAREGTTGVDSAAVESAVRGAYSIGYERTAAEDADYGVQQIVDIGLRALSPGVNDPTTAVHALGHLSAVTARMVKSTKLPAGLSGPQGQLCVVTVSRSAAQDVDAALTPIRHHGAQQPSVVKRFLQVISELSYLCADPNVGEALIAQLDALALQLHAGVTDPASTSELLSLTEEVRVLVNRRADD